MTGGSFSQCFAQVGDVLYSVKADKEPVGAMDSDRSLLGSTSDGVISATEGIGRRVLSRRRLAGAVEVLSAGPPGVARLERIYARGGRVYMVGVFAPRVAQVERLAPAFLASFALPPDGHEAERARDVWSWHTYTAPDGSFSVRLPHTPDRSSLGEPPLLSYSAHEGRVTYQVFQGEIVTDESYADKTAGDLMAETLMAEHERDGYRVERNRPLPEGGAEFLLIGEKDTCLERSFARGGRNYTLRAHVISGLARGPEAAALLERAAAEFFDSFKAAEPLRRAHPSGVRLADSGAREPFGFARSW
ncbi:MAG: hypothetical protein ACJ754_21315 [Pyrinomonadaceae bacterium]